MQNHSANVITDELINKVQQGSERMTEAKAIALAGELYKRGQFKQAANVCKQVIQHKPTHSDAHNILGVSLSAMGLNKEGASSIKRAIKLAPRIASYHANLGEVLRIRGSLVDGLMSLIEAVKLNPKNVQALNNLGIIRYERKEYEFAIKCYKRALEIDRRFPEAYNNLGNSLRMLGDLEGALAAYRSALTYREVYPEAYNNLGTLLRELRKPEQAEEALQKAIAHSPHYIEAHNNLASILFAEHREVAALEQLAKALEISPRNPRSLLLVARIQTKRASYAAAKQACRIVLQDDPSSWEALTVLGQLMHEMDRYEAAIALLEKAVKLGPDQAEARNVYGVALKSVGRLSEAREQILQAIALNEKLYAAYANLNDLVDFSKEEKLFNSVKAMIEDAEDPAADHLLPLHYAYAKALDDAGDHEKALSHYITGGRMKRAQLRYVEEEAFGFFDRIKAAFSADTFVNRPFEGNDDERPVFILGMPRSGSTLVEQIIASHSDVFGLGEVKYFSRSLHALRNRFPALSRYPELVGELSGEQFGFMADQYLAHIDAGAPGARKVTDKLLTNYYFVGLIHLLFPKAKIINTRRDPVDTCLSAFTKLFKDAMPHSYDLGELGRYYRQYESLMDHWHAVLPEGVLMTATYEDLVADTEKSARQLVDFIGLEWQPACLEFYNSDRPVKTASVTQVRRPIYATAIERWRKHGAELQPLLDALELQPS